MGTGIEVRFEYRGMSLVCDEEAFVRLRDIIGTEAAVADAIGKRSDASSVQYISVHGRSVERALEGPGWIELIPAALGGCISSDVIIVGLVTIFQWIVRQLA